MYAICMINDVICYHVKTKLKMQTRKWKIYHSKTIWITQIFFGNFQKFSEIFWNYQKTKCGKQNDFSKSMNFLKRMIMSLVRSSEFSTRWCYYLQKINPRRVEWYHRYWNKKLFPKVFWWYNDIYFTWFLSALPFEHNNFRPPRHHMCSTPQFFCRGQHYDKSVHIFELFRVIGCTCALC